MNCIRENLGFCDFLHKRENYSLTKSLTQSSLGILLSILKILCWISFLIYEIINYEDIYTLSFSQEFLENITNKIQVTFGFQIENESTPNEIDYIIYDSLNRIINKTSINIIIILFFFFIIINFFKIFITIYIINCSI